MSASPRALDEVSSEASNRPQAKPFERERLNSNDGGDYSATDGRGTTQEELASTAFGELMREIQRDPSSMSTYGVAFFLDARRDRLPLSDEFRRRVIDDVIDAYASKRHAAAGNISVKLPGFGLALNHRPSDKTLFPSWFDSQDDLFLGIPLTIRELCMLEFIQEVTDRPEWWVKVHNPSVRTLLRNEAISTNWDTDSIFSHFWKGARKESFKCAEFTPAMAEACVIELQRKANLYEKTKFVPVLDTLTATIKSDHLIPKNVGEAIKAAIAKLENIPEKMKNWNYNKTMLNLVDPSLWALRYGVTRILPDKRVTLTKCLDSCGAGLVTPEVIPVESLPREYRQDAYCLESDLSISCEQQWLPCDVNIKDGQVKIESYINNMHPAHFADLYSIIEQVIQHSLPAWDLIYRWPQECQTRRLLATSANRVCGTPQLCRKSTCHPQLRPLNEGEPLRNETPESYKDTDREMLDNIWFNETHQFDLPDPDPKNLKLDHLETSNVKVSGFFDNSSRIQVVVQLFNIHLTPEVPDYEGQRFRISGSRNEHIYATAYYCYDSVNMMTPGLCLHASISCEKIYEETKRGKDFNKIFATSPFNRAWVPLGCTMVHPGRIVFLPNVHEQYLAFTRLRDTSQPGHCKILALHLVDPNTPTISTANVPPQQPDWWQWETQPLLQRFLPTELTLEILRYLDPQSVEAAKINGKKFDNDQRVVNSLMDSYRQRMSGQRGLFEASPVLENSYTATS
ncbi:hypothetical protein B0I35DRAFT_58845 [Stachybotrys elegans]|uniref:Uncharacterized protein n=1 Tax=Stachybotrys elegans TaxID=80388 RepID=A0A8K0SL22_9HYPO|nr:hypothetical protein B0I35DRAFT_58845 [Stachybotrys elegans]